MRKMSWRAWMVVRVFGRFWVYAAKSVYLVSAVAAIAALGIGLLTLTIGGLLADLLSAMGIADALSREALATLCSALIVGGVIVVATVRSLGPGASPSGAVHRARTAAASRARAFAEEWSTAGVERLQALERRRVARAARGEQSLSSQLHSDTPITAHRVWLVSPAPDGGGASLLAPVTGQTWLGPEIVASCDAGLVERLAGPGPAEHEGPAPDVDCLCGVYGLKRSMWPPPRHRSPLASGTISLTGRVVEATRGYRAERAEIEGTLQISMVCAGVLDGALWTPKPKDFWEPSPPNPCPFAAETLAVGEGEYVGFCAMHRRDAGEHLSGVEMTTPMALSAQLELRYGVEVTISGRGNQWT